MNYKDLVLKILKKRGSVVISEPAILAEFSHHEDARAAFEKWMKQCYIEHERVEGSQSLRLYKKDQQT